MTEKRVVGIKTLEKEKQWEEKFRDEDIKLRCLEAVMKDGNHNDRSMPWNFAQKMYCWVKWGNPDMDVK